MQFTSGEVALFRTFWKFICNNGKLSSFCSSDSHSELLDSVAWSQSREHLRHIRQCSIYAIASSRRENEKMTRVADNNFVGGAGSLRMGMELNKLRFLALSGTFQVLQLMSARILSRRLTEFVKNMNEASWSVNEGYLSTCYNMHARSLNAIFHSRKAKRKKKNLDMWTHFRKYVLSNLKNMDRCLLICACLFDGHIY